MVLFNYSTKELTAKIVYYGPGLCGKTTNLQFIHEKLPIKNKGKMLSLATEADRTLFFDFLPIELGTIRGMKTRIQLYTVPGQVFYNATRRMVLKGADCVIFVADSQEAMIDANLDALANLRENLVANEIEPDEIPTVMQYNKRDLPNALPVEVLEERLNPKGVPHHEAVAMKGTGVEETLKLATSLVFRSLSTKYGGSEASARPGAPAPAAAPRPAAPAPAPPPPPPPRPVPPPPPPPPVAAAPAEDELLESIDLEPAPELTPELPVDESIAFDENPPMSGAALESAAEIQAVPMEELSLEPEEAPAYEPVTEAKATLVSTPAQAEDLRRRIGRPAMPAPEPEPEPMMMMEAEEQDAEDLVTAPAMTMPPQRAPEPARPAPPPPAPPRPAPAPAPKPVPAPVPAAAAPAPIVTAASVPVTVSPNGQTDVTIPLEVNLGNGNAQVTLQIRLTLNVTVK